MLEDCLKAYIRDNYGSISIFCRKIGMAQSTFSTIMISGIQGATLRSIAKICQELNISIDELAKGNIVPLTKEGNKT